MLAVFLKLHYYIINITTKGKSYFYKILHPLDIRTYIHILLNPIIKLPSSLPVTVSSVNVIIVNLETIRPLSSERRPSK